MDLHGKQGWESVAAEHAANLIKLLNTEKLRQASEARLLDRNMESVSDKRNDLPAYRRTMDDAVTRLLDTEMQR